MLLQNGFFVDKIVERSYTVCMSNGDKEYVLANRKWLHAKSLLSYIQAGFSAIAIVLFGSFALFGTSLLNNLPKPSLTSGFSGLDFKTIIPVIGGISLAMIVLFGIQIAISIYTGIQYKKIATATDKLDAKTSNGLVEAQGEYSKFFKLNGVLTLVSWGVSVVLILLFIGTLISFIGLASKNDSSFNSSSYSYSFDFSSDYNYDYNTDSSVSTQNNTYQYDY
jgi:hypothetical protein